MQRDNELNQRENPYATPQSLPHAPYIVANDDDLARNFRPLKTIWTRPRQTVRRITALNAELHVTILACLAGIANALDRAATLESGDRHPLASILVIACVIGPIGGMVTLWIGSHLIRLSGRWIGGIGNRQHIKTAMAWASIPTVFTLPLWFALILLFGLETFSENTPRLDAQPSLLIPLVGIGLVQVVLGIWGLVLYCNTIAEVQGFRSAWRGLGNMMLAGAIIVVPIVGIGLIAGLLS